MLHIWLTKHYLQELRKIVYFSKSYVMFILKIFLFQTPPASYRRQIDIHYGSLPRQQFISNGTTIAAIDSNSSPATEEVKKGVAFGRGLSSLLGGRVRGHSVPNLGDSSCFSCQHNVASVTNSKKHLQLAFATMFFKSTYTRYA